MKTSKRRQFAEAFTFTDEGRTFSCSSEVREGEVDESWWWFEVSGDNNRYAPFRGSPDDTEESVKDAVAKFYTELLAARARPAEPRGHWARRQAAVKTAPETPSVSEAKAEAKA